MIIIAPRQPYCMVYDHTRCAFTCGVLCVDMSESDTADNGYQLHGMYAPEVTPQQAVHPLTISMHTLGDTSKQVDPMHSKPGSRVLAVASWGSISTLWETTKGLPLLHATVLFSDSMTHLGPSNKVKGSSLASKATTTAYSMKVCLIVRGALVSLHGYVVVDHKRHLHTQIAKAIKHK